MERNLVRNLQIGDELRSDCRPIASSLQFTASTFGIAFSCLTISAASAAQCLLLSRPCSAAQSHSAMPHLWSRCDGTVYLPATTHACSIEWRSNNHGNILLQARRGSVTTRAAFTLPNLPFEKVRASTASSVACCYHDTAADCSLQPITVTVLLKQSSPFTFQN